MDVDETPGNSDVAANSDVAIVGMAGRLPGARDVAQFWENLRAGRESSTRYSERELRNAGVAEARLADPAYVPINNVIADADMFDAAFFGIAAREAERIDPQQRVFLECAHHALEDAGYDPDRFDGAIGVYGGIGMNTYLLNNLADLYRSGSSLEKYQLMIAGDKDFQATRVSHKLNLTGPSVNINTACSTSLVVTHMACLGLLNGDCDMALAGAVSIRFPQVAGYEYTPGMIFSPDGHCRAFDANAEGTVLGDGVGIVVLKRLSDALRDRDTIHAVIKGTAINNDGALKAGFTAPSVAGQAAAIIAAQEIAGVDPDTISYVEAHGTATAMGDPIEIAGLTQAFRRRTERTGFCAIGSVKTNIGHLDVAAGMAGLIKTVLMLENRTLVPSLHYERPNPEVDFDRTPFVVQTETGPWQADGAPLRAGVSSFGIGGTNAHVIVEEAPAAPESAPAPGTQLLLLSARTETTLETVIANLSRHLRRGKSLTLADAAFTMAIGRKPLRHRCFAIGEQTSDAALTLALRDEERFRAAVVPDPSGPTVFAFSGVGDTRAAACDLFSRFESHADALNTTASVVDGASPQIAARLSMLGRQYAAARCFKETGVVPDAVTGDRLGLYPAAALAGVLPLGDALALARADLEGASEAFAAWLASAGMQPASCRIVDRATGADVTAAAACPDFWTTRVPVDLGAGSGGAGIAGARVLSFAVDDDGAPGWLAACGTDGGRKTTLMALGMLWLDGLDIDWARWFDPDCRRVPLPTYPFDRKRYFVDGAGSAPTAPVETVPDLLLRLTQAEPHRRILLLTGRIHAILGEMTGVDAAAIDPAANFLDLGLTSLMLIEVAAKLSAGLGRTVAASDLIEHPSVAAFATGLLTGMSLVDARPAQTPPPDDPVPLTTTPPTPSEPAERRKRIRLDVE